MVITEVILIEYYQWFFFLKSEVLNSQKGHKSKCQVLHQGENDLMLSTNWVELMSEF